MLVDLLLLAASLALLLVTAKYFVDGVSGIAALLGVPELVIGMTVVAFGTSAPELVVNTLSAVRGETALAFGNIAGACLLNAGFVLGITALIRPLRVAPSIITREIPMLIVASLALLVLASDQLLNHAVEADAWGRSDGLILLLLFSIFLYYTAREAVAAGRNDPFAEEVREEAEANAGPRHSMPLLLGMTAGGLIGLSLGAQWTVEFAVNIALSLGVSQAVVGLTIVSLGTTLPELSTCIIAARRGNSDIALGNVVGSNILNLLGIGGIVSSIRPVPIPPGGHQDLLFLAVLTVILLPIAIRSGRTITRGEGAVLLASFTAYMGWRIAGAL
ncbi:hypothetical protein F183_A07190 [Bryobacterales bacterium F-183]|nr:hypothetical protein F183_A07190 [Bryobacterales bacterium F-183]